MEILTFMLGTLIGMIVGAYLFYRKVKETNALFLDKLLINSLLRDALKEGSEKKSKKGKK